MPSLAIGLPTRGSSLSGQMAARPDPVRGRPNGLQQENALQLWQDSDFTKPRYIEVIRMAGKQANCRLNWLVWMERDLEDVDIS